MLDAVSLTKSYGVIRALTDLTVSLKPGRCIALIGPNGAGKTTFIKCILGLVRPDSGQLCLDGADLLASPEARRRIGYMPQIGRFPENLPVGRLFDLMRDLRREEAARLDEELSSALKVDRLLRQPAGTLSGGSRQKVSACLAFLFSPDVLILDEPTAGLDPVSVAVLHDKIREERRRGKLILITSHILNDLDEVATDVLYLLEGRMRFFMDTEQLKTEASEPKLGRAVAYHMRRSGGDGWSGEEVR